MGAELVGGAFEGGVVKRTANTEPTPPANNPIPAISVKPLYFIPIFPQNTRHPQADPRVSLAILNGFADEAFEPW
jgi:hypothetical protein